MADDLNRPDDADRVKQLPPFPERPARWRDFWAEIFSNIASAWPF